MHCKEKPFFLAKFPLPKLYKKSNMNLFHIRTAFTEVFLTKETTLRKNMRSGDVLQEQQPLPRGIEN